MGERRFAPFFWTQFLGAFNDNLYQRLVFQAAVEARNSTGVGQIIVNPRRWT